jgi:hypothetical protein
MDEYQVPLHVKKLRVSWGYSTLFDEPKAFDNMFGYDMREVNLLNDQFRSNLLTLHFQ